MAQENDAANAAEEERQDEIWWTRKIANEISHGKAWPEVEMCETFDMCSFIAENEFVIHTFNDDFPMFRVVVEPYVPRDRQRDTWGEDPEYPREDWGREASENDTSLGYWDWVDSQREANAD